MSKGTPSDTVSKGADAVAPVGNKEATTA